MGRKEKKYHYIYKTTNVINNKYYIGMHSTSNLNDGYIGSGKRLWNSINYHGKENHVCEILEYCDNRRELIEREIEVVNEQLLLENLCMNLALGGSSGYDYINREGINNKVNQYQLGGKANGLRLENDIEYRETFIKRISKKMEENHRLGKIKTGKDAYDWSGKKHTDETKLKMSESSKGTGLGKTNSQYGTCWITKGGENKKIKKEDLDAWINDGWVRGRVIKK
jgi:hypothetical protein